MQSSDTAHVTVIMPAYNAEKFIESSVKSILTQSFRSLRLIVVDDGSTDNTRAILDSIAAEDSRLTPVSVRNGGPAAARNRGLELVDRDTEYIMFSDADDEFMPDMIEHAVNAGQGADVLLLGFRILNADGTESLYFEREQHLTADTIGAELGRLYKANLLNQVWAKLFRAELVLGNNLRFPDYRWGEDRLFIYDCLEHASTVAVLPECGYRYIMHPGESLITRYYDKKPEVCVQSDERMESLCRRFGVEDERDFRYMFAKSIFSCLTTLFSPKCTLSRKDKRAEIRRILENERVQSRSRDMFGGFAVRFLCCCLHTRSVTLNYAVFRLVAKIGMLAPRFFTRIKHKK